METMTWDNCARTNGEITIFKREKKERKILTNRNVHACPVCPVLQHALGQATDGQSVQMDVKQIIVSWVVGEGL